MMVVTEGCRVEQRLRLLLFSVDDHMKLNEFRSSLDQQCNAARKVLRSSMTLKYPKVCRHAV